MKARLNMFAPGPMAQMKPMLDPSNAVAANGLDKMLAELVKIRASQINGCAFCLHMHTKDARAAGETEERLYLLSAWRESPLYTDRERAALAWTEALTRIATGHPTDTDYEGLKPYFSPEEIIDLTLAIVTINAWNRIAVGFGHVHPVSARKAA